MQCKDQDSTISEQEVELAQNLEDHQGLLRVSCVVARRSHQTCPFQPLRCRSKQQEVQT